MKYTKQISQAQEILKTSPQNMLHDLTHSQQVVNNAMEIISFDKLDVDKSFVEMLCWWHDVKVPNLDSGQKRIAEVTALYLSNQFEGKTKEIVFDSIKNHEYHLKPHFLEGKILWDADKLELLSLQRYKILKANLKDYPVKDFVGFLHNAYTELPSKFYFEYSKKKFNDLITPAQKALEELKTTYSRNYQ